METKAYRTARAYEGGFRDAKAGMIQPKNPERMEAYELEAWERGADQFRKLDELKFHEGGG